MLTHPIIEQLKKIKLNAMANAFAEQLQTPKMQKMSFEERLGLLVDLEVTTQENKRLNSRIKQAKLRYTEACLADLDNDITRQLDNILITKLATCQWLKQRDNAIITGATGTGKSWLACAFGNKACVEGFKVRYFRLSRLVEELMIRRGDGSYVSMIKSLAKINLLILDDWGMGDILNNQSQQQAMLDILDDRYQQHSTLVTSQYPIKYWHEKIPDPTFADAILDRLLGGNNYKLELKGDSMRKKSVHNEINEIDNKGGDNDE